MAMLLNEILTSILNSFKPQTQQGADIIADQLKVKVFMPDFFEDGEPWPVEGFPPKTDEDKQKLQDFFGGLASPPANKDKLIAFGKVLRSEGVKSLGVYGFCWGEFKCFVPHILILVLTLRDLGGKVIMLAGGEEGTPFDAVSIVHPAYVKPHVGSFPISEERLTDLYTQNARRGGRGEA